VFRTQLAARICCRPWQFSPVAGEGNGTAVVLCLAKAGAVVGAVNAEEALSLQLLQLWWPQTRNNHQQNFLTPSSAGLSFHTGGLVVWALVPLRSHMIVVSGNVG